MRLLGLQCIFVRIDRSEGTEGVYNRLEAVRQTERYVIEEGRSFLFAPEGMRLKKIPEENRRRSLKGNIIGEFQPGVCSLAESMGCPIISIGTKGTEKVLPDNSSLAYFLLFFSWLLILWRGPVDVNIGKPCIIPKGTSLRKVSSREEKKAVRKEADQMAMNALLKTLDEITLGEVR